FYLSVSELAFRYQGMMVFQMQVAKRQDAVPLTRSYIASEEARLRSVESNSARSEKDTVHQE
ncbi:MAG: class I SAM-dependent methyltransferase, partial [Parvibaculaceae bacterium]